jgi:hypothetical protein
VSSARRVQSTAMAVTLHEATARWRVGSPAAVDVEVSREADEVHLLVLDLGVVLDYRRVLADEHVERAADHRRDCEVAVDPVVDTELQPRELEALQ